VRKGSINHGRTNAVFAEVHFHDFPDRICSFVSKIATTTYSSI
jgi:hypothetical protein